MEGEFVLKDWMAAGLNVPTAVKRGVYTVHQRLIVKTTGTFSTADAERLEHALRGRLGLR